MSGLVLFQQKYPSVFTEFDEVVSSLSAKEQKDFFDNLSYFHKLRPFPQNYDFDKNYLRLIELGIDQRHPFLKFLLFYLPVLITPPCLEELEMVLSGKLGVNFQDRGKQVEALRNGFWGHLLEFEAAANFAKYGCEVKMLFKESPGRYPDLECKVANFTMNIEVSNRRYEINTEHIDNIIKNKIVEEAEQLPSEGFNVIIIFLSNPLEDVRVDKKTDIKRMVHMFNFPEALYDRAASPKSIKTEGNIRIVQHKSILETYPKLSHISAIIGWYHGQFPLSKSGFASRCLCPHSVNTLPEEFIQLITKINEGSFTKFCV